jgi:hypothetical protein
MKQWENVTEKGRNLGLRTPTMDVTLEQPFGIFSDWEFTKKKGK